MIIIDNLSKNYGQQFLLDNVSFKINTRERVGIVGRNGHGKTTLFRIITGEEQPDSGSITIPKKYRIGYIYQELKFSKDTTREEGMIGLSEAEEGQYWKVEKILAGLGFSQRDMDKHPGELSGGYQVRLNIAKLLISEPDMLLLDEPTNYLDITSIRWMENFLINWPHEIMLITHDRGFMDKVVTHTIGIHRRKCRKIQGDTGKLYSQLTIEEEVYEKTRINDARRRKEMEQFINRFRAKARLANLVQSRIKTLEKTKNKESLEKLKKLDFSFRYKTFHGKSVLSVQDLSFSYNNGTPLINKLNFSIKSRDRVCIVGQNGKGKTTLLKLLAGELTPQNGEIIYNYGIEKGVFEQTNIKTLVKTKSVEEEILYSHTDIDRQMARNICGFMMFEGDNALKKIEVLSGGEKSRVMLGKILVTPVNLLILDEPTNHLDMESCDVLLSAIDNFEGAVIMVTHNEMYLHAIADRLIVFQNDQQYLFEGSYHRFLEKGGWQDEEISQSSKDFQKSTSSDQIKCKSQVTDEKLNKKEIRQKRSEIITERSKVIKPLEQRIAFIEDEIDSYEKELNTLNEAMLEASNKQEGSAIVEISKSIHNNKSTIDALFDELEELTNSLDEQSTIFKKKLNPL